MKSKDEEKYDWSKLKTVVDEYSKIGRKNKGTIGENGGNIVSNKLILKYIKEFMSDKYGLSIYLHDPETGKYNKFRATGLNVHPRH